MTSTHLHALTNSPLLNCFEAFYYEIIHQKETAAHFAYTTEDNVTPFKTDDTPSPSPPSSSASITQEIQSALKRCIEEQATLYAQQTGGLTQHLFQEVQYVMAALADEIFLNFPFSGAKDWRQSLLEGQLFQTQIAGELIFKRIDAILRSNNMVRHDLGQIYLMALSLGFKGQYNDIHNRGELRWYQEQLYQCICHEPLTLFKKEQEHIIEDCYHQTISGPPSRGLVDLRTWLKYAAVLGGLYLFVSQLVWFLMTKGMKSDIQAILNITNQLRGIS